MNGWVLGSNTSHWKGKINFNKMYDADVKWWYTKASDANRTTGELFEDDRFREYSEAASKTSLLKGCFHWLQASVDPTVAADYYLERYQMYDFEFPPILDFEETSVRDTGMYSDFAWRAQMWCKRVEEVTGRKPFIYTANWYTSYFKTSYLSWMNAYPLMVADYSWWSNNVTKKPYYFPSNIWNKEDCDYWQYTDSAHGPDYGVEALGLCLNWFMGSYADLLMQLEVDEPPEPPTISLEEQVDILWQAHPELHT